MGLLSEHFEIEKKNFFGHIFVNQDTVYLGHF